MSPRPGASHDQIADMLSAGATYGQIQRKLRVSNATIAQVRITRGIEPAWNQTHRRTHAEQIADAEQRYPQVIAMLREGATYRQIIAATGVTGRTITRVRVLLSIPAQPAARRPRTITQVVAQAIHQHLEPHGDGHTRWTGPYAGNLPILHAGGNRYNARREIFRAHHGRAPEGRIRSTCKQPGCMTIAHLADRVIREQHQVDDLYTAIFGDDAP